MELVTKKEYNIRIAKLVFHAKESPIQTWDEVLSLVSSQPTIRLKYIVRLPGYALIQDSLTGRGNLPSAAAVDVFLCQVRAWKIRADELPILLLQFVVFFI